jgi:signal transduction histidine kinase/nitrate/nitrite-specific signal transduction histidine kinase
MSYDFTTGPRLGGAELRPWIIQTSIIALLAFVTITNLLACVFALGWVRQPFTGFFFEQTLVVSSSGNREGIDSPARLLAVNDLPVGNSGELSQLLDSFSPGEVVTLSFETPDGRGGWAERTVSVTLIDFPLRDFLVFYWLPFALGLIYLAVGAWVFKLKGDQLPGQAFALFCAFFALTTGLYFDLNTTHHLVWLWAAALPLTAAALIHLALVFPQETPLARRHPFLKVLPYAVTLPIVAWAWITAFNTAYPRAYFAPWRASFAYVGLSIFVFTGLLLYIQRSASSGEVRQQSHILLLGSVLAAVPVLFYFIPRMITGTAPFQVEYLFLPLVIFPAAAAYTILRYHLLNVDLLISRGLSYSVVTLLITAVYFLVVSVLGTLLQTAVTPNNPVFLALFILLLVVFLMPVKERVQRLADRFFYRERADYRLTLQNYGRTLTSAPLELAHILELLGQRVQDSLRPERTVIFLYDRFLETYAVRSQAGTPFSRGVQVHFARDSDLAARLADQGDILYLGSESQAQSGVKLALEEQARLAALGVVLCVPLRGKQRLAGWLALGPKRSNEGYSADDLVFLNTLSDQTAIAIENAQLLEEAQRRAQGLSALQETVFDIASQLEISQLLKAAVERATKLLQAKGGALYLCDPQCRTLRVEAGYNVDRGDIEVEMAYGEGVAGRVAVQGEPLVLSDYRSQSGGSWQRGESPFGAVIGVPLKWGPSGEIQGVLTVLHEPGLKIFSDEDTWLLSLFANQVSIALDNARLYQRAREQARQLSTINEVGRTIASTRDLPEILNLVMSQAVEILEAEAGSLLLLEGDEELVFRVALGPTGDALVGVRLPVGQGLVGAVAREGEPIIVNDVKSDPRWSVAMDESTQFVTRSILAVPLVSRNRIIGVIEVINKRDGSGFDEGDSRLLTSFASQVAVTIENARLYAAADQALAKRVQELALIWEIDREINAARDFDQIMGFVLDGVIRVTGAASGAIFTLSESGDAMTPIAELGLSAEYRRDQPWPLDKGIIGRAVSSGEAVLLPDVAQAPYHELIVPQTRSELAAPLLSDDQALGVIALQSPKANAFGQDALTFVALLADHAVVAMTNTRLQGEMARKELESAQFLSLVVHELRLPMTSIKGYAKLLEMGMAGEVSERGKEFLGTISRNVERLDRLVEDLLEISRVKTGRLRMQMAPVPIQAVVEEVLQEIQGEIDGRELALTVSIPEDLPPAWGDKGYVGRIISKLLTNAYSYTPPGGEIQVKATFDGEIQVSISDTGVGIAEEDRDKIFTPFFRADDPLVRDYPGNGLGLAVVKGLVESQGGRIWFESEPGVGTTFTFTLTVAGSPDASDSASL